MKVTKVEAFHLRRPEISARTDSSQDALTRGRRSDRCADDRTLPDRDRPSLRGSAAGQPAQSDGGVSTWVSTRTSSQCRTGFINRGAPRSAGALT